MALFGGIEQDIILNRANRQPLRSTGCIPTEGRRLLYVWQRGANHLHLINQPSSEANRSRFKMASGGDAVRKDTANEKRHEGLLDGSNNGRYEEAAHRLRDLQAKYFGPLKRPFTEAALSAKGNAADVREMKEVLQMMREAARCDGCGQASFALGEIYFRGIGVRADAAQAVVWWKLAAEQGESLAHQNLGNIYNYGLNGVDKEYTKAAKYYRLAANQGDTASLFNLAMMYRCGKGVPQNHVEETELITQVGNKPLHFPHFCLPHLV